MNLMRLLELFGLTEEFFLIVKRKSDMLKSLKREGGKHGLQHKDI